MSGLRVLSLLVFLLVAVAALAVNPMTPYITVINDRPMISLRDFAETFDADVDYHVDRDEICITLYDTTIYVVPYRMTAWINDRKVWLDMPVVVVDDVTYLPVRFLCEAFGFRYEWAQPYREVVIVNRWTTQTIIFVIDIEWHQRRHVWRHDYDCHWYIDLHHHKADWGRRDADPPYHHHDGDHPYNDKDRPGGRDQYKDDDRPGGGGYHDGPSDNDPIKGGHDQYVDKEKLPGGPPRHDATDPLNDRPKPIGDQNPRPDYGWPDGGVHHGGYGPQPGKPAGKDDGPYWKRDQRPAAMPPIIYRPKMDKIDWKDIILRPYDGNPHGGPNPQVSGPRPGNQDKGQNAGPQDNGRHEKESKDQGHESKEKDKDSGDKGSEKESKGDKHKDK